MATEPKKVKGINQCKDGRWRAYISVNDQRIYLGRFVTREEAVQARLDAEAIYGRPIKGPKRPKSRILLDGEIAFVEIFSPSREDIWAIIDVDDSLKAYNIRWRLWGNHVYNKIGYLHRIILDARENPLDIDHINRDPLNNRKQNLRLCSRSVNAHNYGPLPKNSSGVRGVCWLNDCQVWAASITVNKVRHYLGHYRTRDEAIEARRSAEKRYGVSRDEGCRT